MFDVWMGEIELTTLVLVFSIAVLLPLQLLLCFRVKSRTVRLLPAILLFLLGLIFVLLSVSTLGWDGLGYVFLAIFAGWLLLMCGVGWGLWAIIRHIRRSRARDGRGG